MSQQDVLHFLMKKLPEHERLNKTITMVVNDELKEKVRLAAYAERRTMSQWILLNIEKALEDNAG